MTKAISTDGCIWRKPILDTFSNALWNENTVHHDEVDLEDPLAILSMDMVLEWLKKQYLAHGFKIEARDNHLFHTNFLTKPGRFLIVSLLQMRLLPFYVYCSLSFLLCTYLATNINKKSLSMRRSSLNAAHFCSISQSQYIRILWHSMWILY